MRYLGIISFVLIRRLLINFGSFYYTRLTAKVYYFLVISFIVQYRKGCYHNEVFLYCVDYMFRPRQRNQYRAALQKLGK